MNKSIKYISGDQSPGIRMDMLGGRPDGGFCVVICWCFGCCEASECDAAPASGGLDVISVYCRRIGLLGPVQTARTYRKLGTQKGLLT